MVKPRYTNAIQKDFAACLKQGLYDFFGISTDVCPVLYTGQPIPVTAKRCVTYSKLNSHRLGFQGRTLITDCQEDSGFVELENWVDEMMFQVNCRSKETITDTEATIVARDIADGLVTWFNSAMGNEYMQSLKIYPLRVSDPRNLLNVDESDQFQSTASFDVTVHIPQCKEMRELDSQSLQFNGIIGVPLRPEPDTPKKDESL